MDFIYICANYLVKDLATILLLNVNPNKQLNSQIAMKKLKFIIALILLANIGPLFAQPKTEETKTDYKHSIETSPLSPLLQAIDKGIWGIKYEYALTSKDELKIGFAYMNIHFEEGNTVVSK